MKGREEKRPRIKWTPNLDEKFNEVVRYLGEKATPIPILELMNLPQLSRKQVENHLQKYRVKKRQAQLVQPASSSIVNQSQIMSQIPPCVVSGNHFNVLNSNEFLINKPPQEPYLPQAHVVPSLVPPDDFFIGLDNLILNLELDLNSKITEKQIDTYYNTHHLNVSNHMEDNGNPSNVLNSTEFHMNFNKPLQEEHLLQPPTIPSLVTPNDFLAGLNDWNQNLELDYFNGKMVQNQISTYYNDTYFNTNNENHSNVLKTKEFSMNFNEPHQEEYLSPPLIIPSLVPPNDLFTRLKDPLNSSSIQDNISMRNQNP